MRLHWVEKGFYEYTKGRQTRKGYRMKKPGHDWDEMGGTSAWGVGDGNKGASVHRT